MVELKSRVPLLMAYGIEDVTAEADADDDAGHQSPAPNK